MTLQLKTDVDLLNSRTNSFQVGGNDKVILNIMDQVEEKLIGDMGPFFFILKWSMIDKKHQRCKYKEESNQKQKTKIGRKLATRNAN